MKPEGVLAGGARRDAYHIVKDQCIGYVLERANLTTNLSRALPSSCLDVQRLGCERLGREGILGLLGAGNEGARGTFAPSNVTCVTPDPDVTFAFPTKFREVILSDRRHAWALTNLVKRGFLDSERYHLGVGIRERHTVPTYRRQFASRGWAAAVASVMSSLPRSTWTGGRRLPAPQPLHMSERLRRRLQDPLAHAVHPHPAILGAMYAKAFMSMPNSVPVQTPWWPTLCLALLVQVDAIERGTLIEHDPSTGPADRSLSYPPSWFRIGVLAFHGVAARAFVLAFISGISSYPAAAIGVPLTDVPTFLRPYEMCTTPRVHEVPWEAFPFPSRHLMKGFTVCQVPTQLLLTGAHTGTQGTPLTPMIGNASSAPPLGSELTPQRTSSATDSMGARRLERLIGPRKHAHLPLARALKRGDWHCSPVQAAIAEVMTRPCTQAGTCYPFEAAPGASVSPGRCATGRSSLPGLLPSPDFFPPLLWSFDSMSWDVGDMNPGELHFMLQMALHSPSGSVFCPSVHMKTAAPERRQHMYRRAVRVQMVSLSFRPCGHHFLATLRPKMVRAAAVRAG
ncbi:hypothetical protein POSPLADRAFT_1030222 [Postia placenta MAD-698-R-SB12]|uniref:Uncharacterized protein n=1 Tax=Postia placenta MAD-698-R-SB12 TaxID=670580 RepID=A0A1X6NEI6_9APHY|nr:hypothetical protein POSPLADRAFT_1030222 [Postia placenta MAD-698-R-SB12]OSX67031.1 hypothetical protein POSPLADRAFT_1030222 [Postia placenta MAD-698-R-SB12]